MQRQLDVATHDARKRSSKTPSPSSIVESRTCPSEDRAGSVAESMRHRKVTGSSIEASIVRSSPRSSIPCSPSTITKPRSTTSTASPGRSGYLDWATQPDPFRRFAGAPLIELPRAPVLPDVPYDALFEGGIEPAADRRGDRWTSSCAAQWDFPRGSSIRRRVGRCVSTPRAAISIPPKPTSSGAVACLTMPPREHAIEERCLFDVHAAASWHGTPAAERPDELLVGLTSIFWREAWKYGERAFRYCQHDLGHAIGALRLAAAGLGWRMALLPRWSDAQIAALLGLDRDGDFEDAEREAPECLAILSARRSGRRIGAGACASRRRSAARSVDRQGEPSEPSARGLARDRPDSRRD